MKIAMYPGTFDPITNGHLDVIKRASEIFDKVIIVVARNSVKKPLFTEKERLEMARQAVKSYENVSVDLFSGLVVDYGRKHRVTAIVRGLRAVSDFEYEFQMALMNRKLEDSITTVFLMPHEKYTYLNSGIVREIAKAGGDVSEFVPPGVRTFLGKKFKK